MNGPERGNGGEMEAKKPQAKLLRQPRRWLAVHLRRAFIAGSLLLVPVALTYLILVFIYDVVNGVLQPAVEEVFAWAGREDWTFPGLGLIAAVILLYITGVVVARGLGVRTVRWVQGAALRVPLIGTIYSASRQLVESFSGTGKTGFKRVVMIQYPREGFWAIGFLTAITTNDTAGRFAVVYIPTAPLPNSGWLALVPFSEVYDTDITPQEAMRFVFSGGIMSPETIEMMKTPEAG